jgi:hypothetical protein
MRELQREERRLARQVCARTASAATLEGSIASLGGEYVLGLRARNVLRGLAALRRGQSADSVERLQIALRYELAANGLDFNQFFLGGMHSAYVRGQALMATKRHTEAAAEFQKILDHRGLPGPHRLSHTCSSAGRW